MTMPEGWFVDAADRRSITDPASPREGLLLPIGDYKGSGLALMIGLIAGVLNGAAFGRDVIDFNADDDERDQHRPFHRCVDIARFCRSRLSLPKSIGICATCALAALARLRRDPPARRTPRRLPRRARCATACRLPAPLFAQLDKLAGGVAVKPLRAR